MYAFVASDQGTLSGSVSTILVGSRQPYNSLVSLLAHELGHNFGLAHANSLDNSPIAVGVPAAAAVNTKYGDPFSNMGKCWLPNPLQVDGVCPIGHVSAQHKLKLGWLESGVNVQDVETSGTYLLQPLEQATSGLQAIHVRRGSQGNQWLWIEYRQPTGFDLELPLLRHADLLRPPDTLR